MTRKDLTVSEKRATPKYHCKSDLSPVYKCCRKGLPIMLGALFLCPSSVLALSLDEQIISLLEDSCAQLTSQIGPSGSIGGTLGGLCDAAGGGPGGTSQGGAAGAVQTAPVAVQERLMTARGEEGELSASVSELMPGFSLFLSEGYESQDRDVTFFEDGYDSNVQSFTIGGDYQFTDKLMAGMAFTYSNHDGDFEDGGDFDNNSYGILFFASILPVDQAFVQMSAGYATKDYDRTRIASFIWADQTTTGPGEEEGSFDGDEYSIGILSGYDFSFGKLSIGPRLGLDYIKTDFDGYSETGSTGLALVFDEANETSLQSRLGLASSIAINTDFGVLLPQAGVNWVHEFEDDQRSESFTFVDVNSDFRFQYENEDPDRDFFEFALGVSAVLPHGWLPYVQFRAIADHDYLDSYAATIGLRKEF